MPFTQLPMVSLFHRSEHGFDPRFPMPLRFEQVDDDTFIEPFFASVPLGSIDLAEYRGMCGRAGYDAAGLDRAHELANAIEAGWRDLGIQVVPRHLLERSAYP